MGVCGLLMRNYESTVAPMVLAVVPGLGVLMMVFYLYPKEFFACGIVGGLGLLACGFTGPFPVVPSITPISS